MAVLISRKGGGSSGGGGGSLPAWWTVDSTPGSESVDFAGALSITPNDPAAYAATFDYSATDDWTGAMLVRVKDVDTLAGNSYVLRVYNEAEAAQVFDLDAWGAAAIDESVGGGPGSANWHWRAADATTVFAVNFDPRSYGNAGFRASPTDVGFFDKAADGSRVGQQATPATLGDVIALLQAYGLSA